MALLRVLLGFANAPDHELEETAGHVLTGRQTAPNAATGAGAVGEWVSAGMYQSTRGMTVTGLTPGSTYNFRVRAVGGSTGYSERSNPVGHMSL